MTTRGERGPTGDHGQDGGVGQRGATGERGATGPPGRDVLSKAQTLVGFVFVVLAFVLLAFRSESNLSKIEEGVERQDRFLEEVCINPQAAAIAPKTCALHR